MCFSAGWMVGFIVWFVGGGHPMGGIGFDRGFQKNHGMGKNVFYHIIPGKLSCYCSTLFAFLLPI